MEQNAFPLLGCVSVCNSLHCPSAMPKGVSQSNSAVRDHYQMAAVILPRIKSSHAAPPSYSYGPDTALAALPTPQSEGQRTC